MGIAAGLTVSVGVGLPILVRLCDTKRGDNKWRAWKWHLAGRKAGWTAGSAVGTVVSGIAIGWVFYAQPRGAWSGLIPGLEAIGILGTGAFSYFKEIAGQFRAAVRDEVGGSTEE